MRQEKGEKRDLSEPLHPQKGRWQAFLSVVSRSLLRGLLEGTVKEPILGPFLAITQSESLGTVLEICIWKSPPNIYAY